MCVHRTRIRTFVRYHPTQRNPIPSYLIFLIHYFIYHQPGEASPFPLLSNPTLHHNATHCCATHCHAVCVRMKYNYSQPASKPKIAFLLFRTQRAFTSISHNLQFVLFILFFTCEIFRNKSHRLGVKIKKMYLFCFIYIGGN